LKATMEAWRGFLRLPACERRIVLAAAAGLAATWLGLRLAGFRRWQQALKWLAPVRAAHPDETGAEVAERAKEIARLEAAAARNFPWRTNCLEESLVLEWLLRRRGIPATLRIGGRKDAERFEAHAWVDLDGENLSDTDAGHIHFVPFEGSVASLETQTH
jgi:hypothetical protein